MSEVKHGIENWKLLLGVVYAAINGTVLAIATKNFSTLSLLFFKAGDLFKVKYSLLDDEWKDLDDAEKQELTKQMREEFDLENDAIEAMIEKALVGCLSVYSLVMEIISLVKVLKEKAK